MVQPARKKSKQRRFSGNHQRGWLWGYHAVTETLATGKWPVIEIFATPGAYEKSRSLLVKFENDNVPLTIVDSDRLDQLSRSTEHQGLVARLGAYPYHALDEITEQLKNHHAAATAAEATSVPFRAQPLVVICDRIQDTFNFGAILRCCDGANVLAVIVGNHSQAEVTPHVARSSSGAVNHIPIVQVDDLQAAAELLKSHSMRIVAADSNASTSAWSSPLSGAIALVIGSEATGIDPKLLAICDQRVCIPMQGKVTSLNAAVATGILLYEIRRQSATENPT